jgi:hypothetical protein
MWRFTKLPTVSRGPVTANLAAKIADKRFERLPPTVELNLTQHLRGLSLFAAPRCGPMELSQNTEIQIVIALVVMLTALAVVLLL